MPGRLGSVLTPRDAVLETYITHIRITEYTSHPTSPPPPQARTPQSEKPRVIIVAVRKSGRVRVHKSKENTNGTFSIGKTWDLNDLTAIDSFTDPTVSPDLRSWAGNVGFVVLLGKPYYWQAQTDKEKKFFIASLLKIYSKYTGGKSPTLSGFDAQELEQIQGGAQRRPQPSQPPQASQPPPPPSRPPMPEVPQSQGAYSVAPGPGVAPAPPADFRSSARRPVNGTSSPVGSFDSGRSANQAALRRLAGSNKSQESVSASLATRSDDGSLRPRSRNGPANGTGAYGALTESPGVTDERPPERRRPPMDPTRPQGGADDGLVPAPLSSTRSRDGVAPPPRSSDRMSPRKASVGSRSDTASLNDRYASGAESARGDVGPLKSPLNGSVAASAARTPEPETPTDSAYETEARPGLGPMIKKKSKGDIAGAFKKAAVAAGAFKPRPGGAGDRLRQIQKRSADGPDGITGVVPAPPRPVSIEKPRLVVEDRPATPPQRSSGIPEVKVIQPPSSDSRPSSLQSSVKESARTPAEVEPSSRRSVVAGNDVKYLSNLGIDPSSVLDARTAEFTKWLDYFGWVPGEQMRSRNFDEVKSDIDRELNKAQAGGWLARFREEDERVGAIKRGIDVAMGECEELDNLLTLYSVELSVSPPTRAVGRGFLAAYPGRRRWRRTSPTSRPRDRASRCRRRTRSC